MSQSQPTVEATLAEQIAQAVKSALPQPQAPQQTQTPPLSDEQIAKLFQRYVPDTTLIGQLFGADTPADARGQALQAFVAGIVQEAVATSGIYHQIALQKFRDDVSGPLDAAREIQRRQTFDDFYTDFPTLKEFDPVVKAVLPALAQTTDQPTDRKEMFKRIASESEKLIKTSRPDFVLTPPTPGGNSGEQGFAAPHAPLGGGGRGGAPTGDPASQQSLATAIFD